MALKLSVAARTARLDAIETAAGATAKLSIFAEVPPADCAAADPATLLCAMTLDADYFNAAAAGAMTKKGTWSGTAEALGAPTVAQSFRLYANDGTTCHLQGTVSGPAGGGDLVLDNATIAAAETVTVTTFTLTDANA